MVAKRIFIRLARCFQEEIERHLMIPLKEKGYLIDARFSEHPLQEQELIDVLQGIDIAVIGTDRMSRRVLEQSKLSMICCSGGGVDHIDMGTAEQLGILVTHTPLANINAVAEFAAAVLMDRMRRIAECCRAVDNGTWPLLVGKHCRRTTVGIIGLGKIGRLSARKISAIGFHVIGFDIIDGMEESSFTYVPFHELLECSDAILIHIPLTEQTRGMIGANEIARMGRKPCIINVSRGGIVDEKALIEALEQDRLSGAVLDVFEHEPLRTTDPLLELGVNKMLVTPHGAATTRDALINVSKTIFSQIQAFLYCEQPPCTAVGGIKRG